MVKANMMLHHIPDLKKGLTEVKRVLKKKVFYRATYGEHGIVPFITELLKPYGVEDIANKNFTLQNGKQKPLKDGLTPSFCNCENLILRGIMLSEQARTPT